MSNGRYCCISRAERPLSSLLAAGAAPLVCPTINDCLEPNVKRLHVLITATAIEAARLTFCVSRGTIGILNFTRTVRKGKKISGGRWPHGLMRIFAVGRENLDRFDNTNSRKSVDQRIHYGFSRGRLTNLSRRIEEDVIPRGWTIRDNFWQIFILETWPIFSLSTKCYPLVTTTLKFKVASRGRETSHVPFQRWKEWEGSVGNFFEKSCFDTFFIGPTCRLRPI